MKLFVATKNPGKIKEIKKILTGFPIELYCQLDFPELPEVIEDKDTFEGNAIKKAVEIAPLVHMKTLADDSGLSVDYLDGAPGVYSARFSGEEKNYAKNNEKLLEMLANVPWEKRTAHFVCVMCLAEPSGAHQIVRGECHGIINYELKGIGGFGYDPLFYVKEYDKTFAELPLEVKNKISHRGKALQKIKDKLLSLNS